MEKDSWVGVTYFYNWNYGANSNVCNSRIQNRSIDCLATVVFTIGIDVGAKLICDDSDHKVRNRK